MRHALHSTSHWVRGKKIHLQKSSSSLRARNTAALRLRRAVYLLEAFRQKQNETTKTNLVRHCNWACGAHRRVSVV